MFQIFDLIEKKTNAILNARTTISNANRAIKKQILVARQKPRGIEVEDSLRRLIPDDYYGKD